MSELFETLRQLVEAMVPEDPEAKRRPSWAPALILDDELLAARIELGYLTKDDKPVARLWAEFADPKKLGSYLRNTVSNLPLQGIRCRGFELHAGGTRAGEKIFTANLKSDGSWGTGPMWLPPPWGRIRTERDAARRRVDRYSAVDPPQWMDDQQKTRLLEARMDVVAEAQKKLVEYEAKIARQQRRFDLHERVKALSIERIAEFAGAPHAQMTAGAHLTGNCAICGRCLTDPISVERGIGPECHANYAGFLRSAAEKGLPLAQLLKRSAAA